MKRRVSKRDLLARLEALEALHRQPTPAPLEGQQTIDLTEPHDHYEQPTLDDTDPT